MAGINKDKLLDKIVADYTRRTREGKAPDIAAYRRKYPAIADEIDDVLSSVAMIESLKAQTLDPQGSVSPKALADLGDKKQLGDYVLIREVGRGGMGVVFEAVHQSLGRRVALKVMLEHELESEKQIARFRREAQAAARLHHTNIVSVFGVGEAEGYHYYVMEYIDGISLKSAVRSLTEVGVPHAARQAHTAMQAHTVADGDHSTVSQAADSPAADSNSELILSDDFANTETATDTRVIDAAETSDAAQAMLSGAVQGSANRYQWVGKVGAQIADALGYSHSMGILHRDIKPANLLLDDQGQVWVTDFGLVKLAGEEQITQTGAVLGTPQYLAPESLKGQYDQKSETYCLGLSLYELATLKPAFAPGSHAEVFNRVIHETPVSPVKIDASMPKDLATIIEKAISKEPKDRYENALALRDDLRAFVEDRPISARRPSLPEQATRWARKNPVVGSLAALSALLVLATAVIATYAWAATNKAYSKLQIQSRETEAAREEAEANAALADLNAIYAEESEQQAIENYRRSEANVELMVTAFDELFVEFLQKDSQGNAGDFDFDGFDELAGIEISIDESDAGYLKKMADFYEQFARQNTDNENLQSNAAKGWRRVANINTLIGDDKAAIESYEKAVSGYREILEQNPDSIEALFQLVSSRSELSNAIRRSMLFAERHKKPLSLIKENLDAIEQHAHRDDPQVQLALAETLAALASAEVTRLATESAVDPDRITDMRKKRPKQSRPLPYDQRARRYVQRAVKIAGELSDSDPENLQYRLLLGKCHCSLGALERNFGEIDVAVESLNAAIGIFRSLSQEDPGNPDFQYQVAVSLLLMPTENTQVVTREPIAEVKRIADTLVQKSPNPQYAQLKIVSRLKMADFLLARDDPRKAIEELKDASKLLNNSKLKGPALHSMLRAFGKTMRGITESLPPGERREFLNTARNKLETQFRIYRPWSRRRRPARPATEGQPTNNEG